MRLLRVEFRRLFARRFTRLATLLLVVVIGLIVFTSAHNSHQPVAGEQFSDVFVLREQLPSVVDALALLLSVFAFLVGASFIGAEWHHGTMASLLLWEPRRVKVYLSKLFAFFGGTVLIGVLGYAIGIAAHWVVARQLGDASGITRGFEYSLGLRVLRGVALALCLGSVGFAVAYAVRLSAAAMGLAIAYFIGGEIGLRAFGTNVERWLLSNNVNAWLDNGTQVSSYTCDSGGNCQEHLITISIWQSGIYLGGIALVVLLLSAVWFARRDVT
jgi:ABC-type transport system involved in multi-copper enzyme maturation permease subunit